MNSILLLPLGLLLGAIHGLQAAPSSEFARDLGEENQLPVGLGASDWRSIREAYESGRHAFRPSETGWVAHNPGQRWRMKVDRQGFLIQPREGGWSWGLELESYGFGRDQIPVSRQSVMKADGLRFTSQRDELVEEWFINDQRGLEHGFTVSDRPESVLRSSTELLSFTLQTRGNLYPVIDPDEQGVVFENEAGGATLTYTGLKVWDADGMPLPSRFASAEEKRFRLLIDDRGARYPIVIDPIAQRAYLKPVAVEVAAPPAEFGYAVAADGNMVVVGAPQEDSNSIGVNSTPVVSDNDQFDSGAAYIFTRNGSRWIQEAYLKPNLIGGSQEGDRFGHAVAVSNGTVVVGAPYDDSTIEGEDSGAVYVFAFDSETATWKQEAFLKPEVAGLTQAGDRFGWSVAVEGDTLAIGAPFEDSSTLGINSIPDEEAESAGAAYLFVRSEGYWSQEAYVKPEAVGTTQVGDLFGWSVATFYNGLVVGAPSEDSSTTGINTTPEDTAGPLTDSGASYVFVRTDTTWSQQAFLKPDAVGSSQEGDQFGFSVSAAGSFFDDFIIVGAPSEDSSSNGVDSVADESGTDAGAAYVFVRDEEAWMQEAYLKPDATGSSQVGDRFGSSVAISPSRAVVGAPFEDSDAVGIDSEVDEEARDAGAAYVFARSSETWSQETYLKPQAIGLSQTGDQFGFSVAISDSILCVGAPLEDSDTTGTVSDPNENVLDVGAAYVMALDDGDWGQQAYLKSAGFGEPQDLDYFGRSVAISGDTVVVGAYQEDSSSLDVNSVPNDRANEAGAAYVFVQMDGQWTQQAYLKPTSVGDTQAWDEFGHAVAISGDTLVVGAHYESSSSLGVNSVPNEEATGAGAAYVFVRDEGGWTQEAYLKPLAVGHTQEFDQFGYSVAISGDVVVVGAPREDAIATGVNQIPDDSATNAGAAYIFVRDQGSWTQEAYLKPGAFGRSQVGDGFGTSVAVSGGTVVVGAPWESSSTAGVTIPLDEAASFAGAVYVFVRHESHWNQQAYLKPATTGITQVGDRFGWSVAVDEDVLIVGAPWEDSASKGINSSPDENASDAGAAYIFTRSEGAWSQQAYLKPGALGQTQSHNNFGCSVAISGGTAVVGARWNSDSSTGINLPLEDTEANSAGAAYVFVKSDGRWSQRAYLKPEAIGLTQEYDLFGSAVAVAEGTVLVGAPGESSSASGVNRVPNEHAYSAGAAYIYDGVDAVLAPIQSWRQTNFSVTENAGTAANDMDLDADGWSNLVEYGVVTNPSEQGEGSITLGVSSDGRYLEASFTRDPRRNDATINVQTADSPVGPWATVATSVDGTPMIGPGLVSETNLSDGLIQVDVRDTVPVSAAESQRRFLRIVVE